MLDKHGLSDRVEELNIEAVKLARKVCPDGKFVAGSIGPTGEIFQPLGSLDAETAKAVFREQAIALEKGGADIIFVETMMSVEELECAVIAAKEATNLPVSASMTFNVTPNGVFTHWGVDTATFVRQAEKAGADVISSYCGKGFDEMIQVITEIRGLTKKPLMAQANAGMPELIDGKHIYKETAKDIAPKAAKLLALKIDIIGGCCGTGPEHIAEIRNLVKQG